ncbi:uncharacterized protein NPIL_166941 [Nephila pilipes]|uniref:G-protein coupled receptors family 1 profile domain-containing protein n=1 Tax=Nephila pilipes TaxID=299642 RepID=A0A8X6MUX2_NEPPI|nr:uncharacterized protein NPIL_166941 [Nephila pilipes]
MYTKDILNASVEAVKDSLGENSSKLHNVTIKFKETDFGSDNDLYIQGWPICVISIAFMSAYFWAIDAHIKYSTIREPWYCIYYLLVVSYMNEIFCLPTRLKFIFPYLLCKDGALWWVKHGRRYILTLYAYALVSLAIYSYNLVFKTLFKSPFSRMQWYVILVGLCIISSLPTLYFLGVYGWTESHCGKGFFTYTWQFVDYPGQFNMTILLLANYIVPACLITFLLGRVGIELLRRRELFLFKEPKMYSLCLGDRKCIAMAFCTCFAFVIASIPFIIHETVRMYVNPNLTNSAEIIEIISFSNLYMDPCFVLVLQYGHYWIWSRASSRDLKREWVLHGNKLDTYRNNCN